MTTKKVVEVLWCRSPGRFNPNERAGCLAFCHVTRDVRSAVERFVEKHLPRDGEERFIYARFTWDRNEPGQCFKVTAHPGGPEWIEEVKP